MSRIIRRYSHEWKPLDYYRSTTTASEIDEFIQVECKDADGAATDITNAFYRDYFAFVSRKKQVEERCKSIDTSLRTKRINVMLVGLDALSRLNFQRQMPTTHEYLVKQMNAIEMRGYNKLGDNTFPNLVPLLTGLSENELQTACLNNSSISNKTFDDCPFVWNFFRDNGYRLVHFIFVLSVNRLIYSLRHGNILSLLYNTEPYSPKTLRV